MQKCRICDSTDFYKEAGYFFCQICQTQNEVLQFFFFFEDNLSSNLIIFIGY